MSAIDGKIIATKCPCYKAGQKMTPKGIVVHSTGAPNPNLKRYVQPDDGNLGYNDNHNSWNEPSNEVIPHLAIGKDKNGNVKTYQVLPFDICCWCVGSGWNGSYNYNPAYIQFEICEDDLDDKAYCTACYKKAVELCVYLCKKFGFSISNIVSHHEAGASGMGSQHVDPDNWWPKFGYSMNGFRADVRKALNGQSVSTTTTKTTNKLYRIRKSWKDEKSQIGAYSSLENAKAACKTGYTVYDEKGNAVYPPTSVAKSAPSITYAVFNGGWLPAVKNLDDYAGVNGTNMQGLVAKSSVGTLEYRVHIRGKDWLPWVNKYDTSDWNNGIAGYKGATIDGVQMRLKGASGYTVKYRVSVFGTTGYYDWVVGDSDYAGSYGRAIDCIQICAVKA